jgi:hypothetical protein
VEVASAANSGNLGTCLYFEDLAARINGEVLTLQSYVRQNSNTCSLYTPSDNTYQPTYSIPGLGITCTGPALMTYSTQWAMPLGNLSCSGKVNKYGTTVDYLVVTNDGRSSSWPFSHAVIVDPNAAIEAASDATDAANAATDAANVAAEGLNSILSSIADEIASAIGIATSTGVRKVVNIAASISYINARTLELNTKISICNSRGSASLVKSKDLALDMSTRNLYTSSTNSWTACSRAYSSAVRLLEMHSLRILAAQSSIDKAAADKAAADKAVADKAAADKAVADKAAADKAAADKAAADAKAIADKAAADKAAADAKAIADKAALDKAAADKAAADKAAADKATADKATADKAVADKAAADLSAQKMQQDDFNLVMRNYQKLMLRIYNLKIKYPRVSNLLGIEEKMIRLPIILGNDLSTAKYNIQSANSSLDASEKVWEKTQKTTITCIKGKLTKKVTAVKPKCPTGYKLKK